MNYVYRLVALVSAFITDTVLEPITIFVMPTCTPANTEVGVHGTI
jgi:hypothetical protein